MLEYQPVKILYTRIHRYIWNFLFGSKFKRFGRSSLQFPYIITGPEHIEIGDRVTILNRVWLNALKIDDHIPHLVIGDCVRINRDSTIAAVRDVQIGKNVIIGERAYISDNVHEYRDVSLPIRDQPILFKNSVHIGDNSWIGTSVSIIGAKIGKHCVIGANSVVTRDIQDYCVAVGAPAKVVKRYNFETNKWQKVDENREFI